jgi:uncharacterized membrane protein YphA (DoxX/SURF4 family)
MSKRKNIAVWSLTIVLALLFLAAGAFKLTGAQEAIDNFHRWGYPDWFRVLTGVIEVAGAIGLLVPKASWFAAAGLSATMLGAIATHLHSAEATKAPLPLTLLVLLVVVGWARRPRGRGAAAAPAEASESR